MKLAVLPNSERPGKDNARSRNQKAGPSGSSPLIAALRRAATPRLALKDQARHDLALHAQITPHFSIGPRAAARASGGTTGASSHKCSSISPLTALAVGELFSNAKPCPGSCPQAEAARALLDLGASPLLSAADGTSLLAQLRVSQNLFREVFVKVQGCRRCESRSVRMPIML